MLPTEQLENLREQKGKEIATKESQVHRMEENFYTVHSQSGNGEYEITSTEKGWSCTCPDHQFREVRCKHIWAVIISNGMRQQASQNVATNLATQNTLANLAIQPVTSLDCVFCGSADTVKNEVRHNKYGDNQRYLCKACGKRFSVNVGFEKMKASPQVITSAMQLYFTGESLRNVQKFLMLQGVKISHVGIYKWISKYIALMTEYLEKIKPEVSDTWKTKRNLHQSKR